MQTLYYHQFMIKGHTYILAATTKGLAFVGSVDGNLSEINDFFEEVELIDNESKLQKAAEELSKYLSNQSETFDLKLDVTGTSFQEAVWQALEKIPYGEVRSYTQIAEEVGKPKAVRAVGSAIGKNPVLMVIPCHRVVTKDGKIGQYRGGTAMKKDLLTLEGHLK